MPPRPGTLTSISEPKISLNPRQQQNKKVPSTRSTPNVTRSMQQQQQQQQAKRPPSATQRRLQYNPLPAVANKLAKISLPKAKIEYEKRVVPLTPVKSSRKSLSLADLSPAAARSELAQHALARLVGRLWLDFMVKILHYDK